MEAKKYYYSEIFRSIQGEGHYTGHPTMWLRYFGCNLECNGFGQKNPKDPSTFVLPYKNIDVSGFKKLEDLPVFTHGCDSSYSWSKKFKGLQHHETAEDIAKKIIDKLPPLGWGSLGKNNFVHMAFTGGEPMLPKSQECTVEILEYFYNNGVWPYHITFETNGTNQISKKLLDMFKTYEMSEIFFSISPKLYSVSGEDPLKAIRHHILKQYHDVAPGQLKFVCNGTKEAWDEIDTLIYQLDNIGIYYPIWIMPVGGTVEGLDGEIEGFHSTAEIAEETIKRGYNVAARVHAYIWGNKIGT
jgi:7-carboxy-7-deazaguanine synthase